MAADTLLCTTVDKDRHDLAMAGVTRRTANMMVKNKNKREELYLTASSVVLSAAFQTLSHQS